MGYIVSTKPHTNNLFNKLEFFNEGLLILMCYTMIIYSGIGQFNLIIGSPWPILISIVITVLIVVANFFVVIKMNYSKLMKRYKEYKQLRHLKHRSKIIKRLKT